MTEQLLARLQQALPDERVESDLRAVLQRAAAGAVAGVELDGQTVAVPVDAAVEVVDRSFYKNYFRDWLPAGYHVQVAVGGVIAQRAGILRARYCFATLYYDAVPNLITLDFHAEMR